MTIGPEVEPRGGPPQPRPRLRNVSSSSTLLGVSLSSSSSTAITSGYATTSPQLGGPYIGASDPEQTPLAAPPPVMYEAAAGIVAGPGQRASAIGYPFPPVGDLGVPGSVSGGGVSSAIAPARTLSSSNLISIPTAAPSTITTTSPLAPRSGDGASSGLSLSLKPLDYSRLSSRESIQDELESTLLQMGRWLNLVSDGLGRVISDEVDVGVRLVDEGRVRDGMRSDQGKAVAPLQASA